ncbi:MAG: hypothetical protein GF315_09500 [candidate division Zixibacteria bacterium]|nr:hypothetical protein [candidate division Zixibacteria bacterium]
MRLLITILILISLVFTSTSAYNDKPDFGVISSVFSGADIAMPSEGSGLLINPGYPLTEHSYNLSCNYTNHYNIAGLNSNSITSRLSIGRYVLGAEYAGFGKNNLYGENNFRISGGVRLHKHFYAGLMYEYLSLDIGSYTNYASFGSIGFSGGYNNGTLGIAASVSGIKLNSKNIGDEEINKLYLGGLSYRIANLSTLYLCFGSHSPGEWLGLGQSISLNQIVSIHLGLRSKPTTPAMGISLSQGFIRIGYSYRYHPVLGDTHQAGLILNLKRKEE